MSRLSAEREAEIREFGTDEAVNAVMDATAAEIVGTMREVTRGVVQTVQDLLSEIDQLRARNVQLLEELAEMKRQLRGGWPFNDPDIVG